MEQTKLFRLRTSDGYVSPTTAMTNVHGTDMNQMIVPAKVGVAIMKKQVDWRDVVRCVASGKDPSILLTTPDAVKPRQELADAPDFDEQKAIAAAALEAEKKAAEAAKGGELALARAENRAPDLAKLTEAELAQQAALVGVNPKDYSTQAGLIRAITKKMSA